MKLSPEAILSSSLSSWAESLNIPLLVRWRGSNSAIKLGKFDQPLVTLDVLDGAGAAALLSPTIDNLGSAYVEGRIEMEGKLDDVLEIAHRLNASGVGKKPTSLFQRLLGRIATTVSHHSRQADKESIQYHYDVSNDFYAKWLDPAMVYSCGYFERGDETLEQAQVKKIDHILTKLQLQPGQKLLDIGCGWGALVLRAAKKFGAQCLGVTLSQNQYDLALERVKANGLQGQIEIRLQDYRDISGQFDRITSVGMFEHVGLKNLPQYFQVIHDLLTPQGWALNHGITSTDPYNKKSPDNGGRFIEEYVFPNGELPHIGTVLTTMQEGGLEAVDVEGLRRHYERTLKLWSQAFEANSQSIRPLVDDKRWRIWRLYLIGCQWAFENDVVSIFQVLCHRAKQSAKCLPWSRRQMYAPSPQTP